jgi:hypothetical protein
MTEELIELRRPLPDLALSIQGLPPDLPRPYESVRLRVPGRRVPIAYVLTGYSKDDEGEWHFNARDAFGREVPGHIDQLRPLTKLESHHADR